jgi:hypothetical protein
MIVWNWPHNTLVSLFNSDFSQTLVNVQSFQD